MGGHSRMAEIVILPMERLMDQPATLDDGCPNAACPTYHQRQMRPAPQHIIKVGKTRRGVQRYECTVCGRSFTATRGTLFYRKRTPERQILETLARLAAGNRMSTLSRTTGFKEDTILQWVREAAQHPAQIEAVLLHDFQVSRDQLDRLWTYGRSTRTPKGPSTP